MNVLITGALGWLGKALVEVVSKEHTVRGFDISSSDVPHEDIDFDGEITLGSITNFAAVRKAMQGQNAIIHTAVANTRRDENYFAGNETPFLVNVFGLHNVLEAARLEGIRRFILIASAETHVEHPLGTFIDHNKPYYGLPENAYDLTKHLQEQTCRWFAHHCDMNIIALRLGDILDLKSGTVKWNDDFWRNSMATGSWIDRYDVGHACLRALEIESTGFEVFHLVGSPSAKEKFDIERTEAALGIEFTKEFDHRPASERG